MLAETTIPPEIKRIAPAQLIVASNLKPNYQLVMRPDNSGFNITEDISEEKWLIHFSLDISAPAQLRFHHVQKLTAKTNPSPFRIYAYHGCRGLMKMARLERIALSSFPVGKGTRLLISSPALSQKKLPQFAAAIRVALNGKQLSLEEQFNLALLSLSNELNSPNNQSNQPDQSNQSNNTRSLLFCQII